MTTTTTDAGVTPSTTTIKINGCEVRVICEPVTEWLAIVPGIGIDHDGATVLLGGFTVVHRGAGLGITEGFACMPCCRDAAHRMAALASADWSTLAADNAAQWSARLSDEDRSRLAVLRAMEFGCDAEVCDLPAAPAEQAGQ